MGSGIVGPVESALEKTVGPEITEKAGQFVLGSMRRLFDTEHPVHGQINKDLLGKAEEFLRKNQVYQDGMNKDFEAVKKGIDAFPDLKSTHGKHNTPMAQIHADLMAKPGQVAQDGANAAASLLAHHPTNATRTLKELSDRSPYQSRLASKFDVFGQDNRHITPMFYDLHELGKNSQETLTNANNLADVFSRITQDKVADMSYGKRDPITGIAERKTGEVSRTKKDIEQYIIATNKLRPRGTGVSTAGMRDVKPMYQPPSELERRATNFVYRVMAPWIVIPHVGQFFNLGGAGWNNLAKAAFSMTDPQFRDSLTHLGIAASTQHSIMNELLHWESGKTANIIGSKAAGIMGKFLYNPGFHPMRYSQLMFGGAVGYHALEEWTDAAITKGDHTAIENLKLLRLDPTSIISRGGLNPEEYAQGIYHFVNDRLFIDKVLNRSLKAGSNVWLRNMAMFHTFVSHQSSFMMREMARLVKTRDFVGLTQYAATIGILFPQVAPMMKSAEVLLRTGDPSKAKESMEQDYGGMWGSDRTPIERVTKWADMFSYIGAFGVLRSFWTAAEGHRLGAALGAPGGPIGSAIIGAVEDAVTGIKGTKAGEHHFQPLARQILRYLPEVGGTIGGPAGHVIPQLQTPKSGRHWRRR